MWAETQIKDARVPAEVKQPPAEEKILKIFRRRSRKLKISCDSHMFRCPLYPIIPKTPTSSVNPKRGLPGSASLTSCGGSRDGAPAALLATQRPFVLFNQQIRRGGRGRRRVAWTRRPEGGPPAQLPHLAVVNSHVVRGEIRVKPTDLNTTYNSSLQDSDSSPSINPPPPKGVLKRACDVKLIWFIQKQEGRWSPE